MASIRQRKTRSGELRYYVEIRRKGAPPVRKTFVLLSTARAWARDVEAEIQRGHMLPRLEATKHTVGEAIDRYLEDHLDDLSSPQGRRDRRSELAWWRRKL
ncbi:MAG: site-specific integrase, partial [Thermoanaerobaculia bacterium]